MAVGLLGQLLWLANSPEWSETIHSITPRRLSHHLMQSRRLHSEGWTCSKSLLQHPSPTSCFTLFVAFFLQVDGPKLPPNGQANGRISSLQNHSSSLTQPHLGKHSSLYGLAAGSQQFTSPGASKDLNQIMLPPIEESSLPITHPTPNGLQIPTARIPNLLHYPEGFIGPKDANSKIIYLRYIHDQSPEALNIPHHGIRTTLVDMFATRAKGEAGYALALEDSIGTVIICHRLLTSNTPPDSLIRTFQNLTRAVLNDFYRIKQMRSLDQVVECLREALKTCGSSLRQVSLNPANLLTARFHTHMGNDYQKAKAKAKAALHNIIVSHSHRDISGLYHIQASAPIALIRPRIRLTQSIINSNLEDPKEAVSGCRSFLDNYSLFGAPLNSVIPSRLLASHVARGSEPFEPLQGAQVVHSLFVQLGPFRDEAGRSGDFHRQTVPPLVVVEEKIRHLQHLCSMILPGTERQKKCLDDLVYCYDVKIFLTHDDITTIEESIKYRRMLLATTHPSDPSISFRLSSFGNFLYLAFRRARRVEYLDESITHHRKVLGLENAWLIHFATIRRLIGSLSIRWQLSHHKLDLDEIMHLFTLGVSGRNATVATRFKLACHWAYSARVYRHPSVLTAYKNAMSLMQESLVFAPTLPIQHDRLVERRDLYEKTPLDFASYHIRAGQLEQAVETLEQGRALLWSEMRGLRTSTDLLRVADPLLAERFTAINQELEMLTTSTSSNGRMGTGGEIQGGERMAQLPGLMARQHELLKERDALILKIRVLPGLENFSFPLSFNILRSAASHGPVIIINHCKWRSDIIIVLHNSPPSLITMPYNFFDLMNGLKGRLLGIRQRCGSDCKQYVRALISVLKDLYDLIGGPLIKRLTELGIPEQSRVWWCPTSVSGYLPLHAMGPVRSDGGVARYFSDLYICSYTPTLSALITSRNAAAQNLDLPNILLVAQPDPSLPGVSGEIQVIQSLNLPVTSLISQSATPSTVLDGLHHHRFCHFACHGVLTTGKPFGASLVLHKEPLMLLDIVRSRLPAGECAFLATCQSAACGKLHALFLSGLWLSAFVFGFLHFLVLLLTLTVLFTFFHSLMLIQRT